MVIVAVVVLGLPLGALAYWAYWRQHSRGNPDPGGRTLRVLAHVSAAVPPGARVLYRHDVEPRWDSCDGIASTAGWDDVVVQIHFSSGLAPESLLAEAQDRLAPLGWGPVSRAPGPELTASWSERIPGAPGRAGLQLTNSNADGNWTLFAHTSPVGRPVSGC